MSNKCRPKLTSFPLHFNLKHKFTRMIIIIHVYYILHWGWFISCSIQFVSIFLWFPFDISVLHIYNLWVQFAIFFVSRLRHIISKYCTFFLCALLNFFRSIFFSRCLFGFKWGDDILIYCYWYIFNSQLIFISNRSNRNAIQFSPNLLAL